MKVLHIISTLSKINIGVWNAAIFAHDFMYSTYGVESELWVCSTDNPIETPLPIPHFFYNKQQLTKGGFLKWLESYPTGDTVIISHGAWLKPARLGFWAAQMGYKWIYTPHGMFENYTIIDDEKVIKHGLRKGLNKKSLYYSLVEKKYIQTATAIRAVSKIEQHNLEMLLGRKIELIYNGISSILKEKINKDQTILKVLFLSRLHYKKGIINLVKAWQEIMGQNRKFKLIIAGPDEGELIKIKPFFTDNIEYVGAVYGENKTKLLEEAHYFILPSYSEGFPTSVVEAMGFGAIPIVTEGCNFPEIFEFNLGYKIKPEKESIKKVLETIANVEYDSELSKSNIEYVEENLTEKKVAADYYQLYNTVLNKKVNGN